MHTAAEDRRQGSRCEIARRGRKAVIAAYEAGYTLFDHADIYGQGRAETVFGQVLKEVSGMRDRVILASKCGIRLCGDPVADAPYRYDFSAEHIVRSCEGSLSRLGVERIDLYQLHRPDYLMCPEEVAEAFSTLKQAGKVRRVRSEQFSPLPGGRFTEGLSHATGGASGGDQPGQPNLFRRRHARSVPGGRHDAAGLEPAGRWFARQRRTPSVALPGSLPDRGGSIGIGQDRPGAWREPDGRSVAWLLKHPSRIVPIVGSTEPAHIREAVSADTMELSREEWYGLLEAARGERLP